MQLSEAFGDFLVSTQKKQTIRLIWTVMLDWQAWVIYCTAEINPPTVKPNRLICLFFSLSYGVEGAGGT